MSNRPIRFEMNWEKTVEVLVWLANKKPGISQFYVAKILYYADKQHLLKFGRPIIGDTYVAMKFGPVPSSVRNMINQDAFIPDHVSSALHDALVIEREGKFREMAAKRQHKSELLSDSDIDCLEQAYSKYAHLDFGALSDVSHTEKAWKNAFPNGWIDYADMFDGVEDAENLIDEIRENAAYAVV